MAAIDEIVQLENLVRQRTTRLLDQRVKLANVSDKICLVQSKLEKSRHALSVAAADLKVVVGCDVVVLAEFLSLREAVGVLSDQALKVQSELWALLGKKRELEQQIREDAADVQVLTARLDRYGRVLQLWEGG